MFNFENLLIIWLPKINKTWRLNRGHIFKRGKKRDPILLETDKSN